MGELVTVMFLNLMLGLLRVAHLYLSCMSMVSILMFGTSAALGQLQETSTVSQTSKESSADTKSTFITDVCKRIEMAARMWTLPPAFFARLIWKESRFNPNAVSPVGASGIAQFMPGTARLRNLEDPFDPRTAIPASAHYLSDLRNQFGNLGLAAAAYNAGPGRVQRWRNGKSGLPHETWDFVTTITGVSPNEWNGEERPKADYTLDKKLSFLEACSKFPIRPVRPRPQYANAPWQPWGVHLTADWSPSKALSHYARLQRKHPEILAGLTPMVLREINHSFGRAPRFEVRIGQPDRAKAKTFCSRIKKAGGPCLVIKTKPQ